MPDRSLNQNDNLGTIDSWLNANMVGPIVPNRESLTDVPADKGIYFWFMNPKAYSELSRFVTISDVEPRFEKEIDGIKYHLVYLGTAGTGKNGGGHLFQRLTWHITQQHTQGSVCHGTLSTFRAGLGSLLSDDLILCPPASTEIVLHQILQGYFKVYWIPYDAGTENQINADELVLIRKIKPLFNLRNNPNQLIPENSTYIYKQRRNHVYEKTKSRLNCNELISDIDEATLTNANIPLQPIDHDTLFESIFETLENDFSKRRIFNIYQNESIHDVVQNLNGYLPVGFCKFVLYDPLRKEFLYGTRPRSTGRGNQNIFTYFNNVDTGRANVVRWMIIKNEMIQRGLDEIMVEVFFD